MTDYPHRHPHDLMSEALLDELVADAENWRTLLHALKDRGHSLTTLEQLIEHFPDFIGMANSTAEPLAAKTTPALQGPPGPFLDAFLTPCRAKSSLNQTISIQRIQHQQTINVREFAEAETTLGTVTIGYTDDGALTFTLQHNNATYLIPIAQILEPIIAVITMQPRSTIVNHKPTNRIM